MPLSQADRIAFSLKIVSSDDEVKGIQTAQALIAGQQAKLQSLDDANKNLFTSPNNLVNYYHSEISLIDGNLRTSILEQDIQDAANHKLQNHFFPNDTSIAVPSLSTLHNVWPRTKPFALTYAIGKNYTETYSAASANENSSITAIQGFLTAANANTDIQNTTGQKADTVLSDPIITFTALQTLATNLITAVNAWKTGLLAEAAALAANLDTNVTNAANNTAAANNINAVIVPAINTWLAYATFNPMPGTTTGTVFNATNANTRAPTKLHSTERATFSAAVTARAAFVSTRTSQINAVLGTIVQDITTGSITSSSGFYGSRYGFLVLRIDGLNGSLSSLSGFQAAIAAQLQIISSIQGNKATYASVVPTTLFSAPGNGTNILNVVDASAFSPGDAVWLIAENQEEIQRAIKSITGKMVVLNDVVPAKFRPADKARMYKDLS